MRIKISFILILFIFWMGCSANQSSLKVDPEKQKAYANELLNQQLYEQAIVEFQSYLDNNELDDNVRANINYIIANTYLERLRDYHNAMAYFLKVKNFYPGSPMVSDANKGIVKCLERLNRSTDAQQALTEMTTINPGETRTSLPGTVIAKVGDWQITQGDLDAEIDNLPPTLQQEYQKKDKKLQFLQQMVATELMYKTAQRKGYEDDKEIIDQIFQAKKSILVQKLIEDEISGTINVTDFDIKMYYDANKEQYKTKDEEGNEVQLELPDIKSRVKLDVQRAREQEAYQQLIQRLLVSNNVEILSDLVE